MFLWTKKYPQCVNQLRLFFDNNYELVLNTTVLSKKILKNEMKKDAIFLHNMQCLIKLTVFMCYNTEACLCVPESVAPGD